LGRPDVGCRVSECPKPFHRWRGTHKRADIAAIVNEEELWTWLVIALLSLV
jgi:hypothetical protein